MTKSMHAKCVYVWYPIVSRPYPIEKVAMFEYIIFAKHSIKNIPHYVRDL